MKLATNARIQLANCYTALFGVIVLAVLWLPACAPQPSTPPPTAIISSPMPSLTLVPTIAPVPSVTPAPVEDIQANIEAVEYGYVGSLPDRMEYYNVPGVSIAVINHGQIEWARGYGVLDFETTRPVTADTLFQAASLSKPVAALAALHYVQTGALSLDEDVNNKLVSWQVPDSEYTRNAPVTLRGLLSHSAGLTIHGFAGYAENEALPSLLQILDGEPPANSNAVRVFAEPGTQWQYSGGGYVVVQQLLEDVTGTPFPEMMQAVVLDPLGMENSSYAQPLPPEQAPLAAIGYDSSAEMISGNWHTYPELAAAGLWTTPTDLAHFILELQQSAAGKSNQVISADLIRQMLTPQMGDWGLGLQVGDSGEDAWFAHSGSNAGFNCYMFGFVENGQGAVVMTNSDNGYDLAMEILRAISITYDWPYMP